MRRGEVPFVAVRVGRGGDAREVLGLARDLRIPPAHALGIVVLWEEFFLEIGDARSGRIRGYSADHIAVKLGWSGPTKKLIDSLARAGLLKRHKGTWVHPYWRTSITGQYANDKAEQRDAWRVKKQNQRKGDVPEMSPGHVGDVPPLSPGKADIKKEMNGENGAPPPPAPPATGGRLGASRWEWMRQNHRSPSNPEACKRYLALISEQDWALCQWVTTLPPGGGGLKLSRKKRVLGLNSYKFLANQEFLQFLPEWQAKLRSEKEPPGEHATKAVEAKAAKLAAAKLDAENAERRERSSRFVLEALADDSLSEVEKEKARARWRAAHPDEAPPWGH